MKLTIQNPNSQQQANTPAKKEQSHSPNWDSPALKKFAATTVPGLVEVTINCPLVTAKNLLQNGADLPKPKLSSLPKLYKGYGTLAAGYVPYNATLLGVNDKLLDSIAPSGDSKTATVPTQFSVGAIAGATASVIISPVEQIMTQQQLRPGTSFCSSMKSLNQQGARGHFRGLGACMARESLYGASLLGLSNSVKANLPQSFQESQSAATLLSGITAGTAAGVITQPLDTIKTKQQATDPKSPAPQAKEIAKELCQTSISQLWRGTIPRSARIGFGAAIILGVKEKIEASS